MSKRLSLAILLIFLTIVISGADNNDAFLGIWYLKDNNNYIKVVKEGEKYFVIEFVNQKHELFISGDGKRALFIEFGKGPGWETIMLKLEGETVTDMYFAEDYTWKPTQYVYYKRF